MTVSVTRDPKCAKMRKYRPTEELCSSTELDMAYVVYLSNAIVEVIKKVQTVCLRTEGAD